MSKDELPQHAGCDPRVTLDTCRALRFELVRLDGERGAFVVWNDTSVGYITPLAPILRLRDLRPGDRVLFFGHEAKLTKVEIYR